jgi:hypothetical protein
MLITFSLLACDKREQPLVAVSAPSGSNLPFHGTISPQEKKHILDGPCSVITSVASIPKSLKDGFVRVTEEREFALADPDKEYQESDEITTPGLPFRRLVFAGSCGDRWFVHYEHGGIGLSYKVLIFRTDANGALRFLWGGSGCDRAKSLDNLRVLIASGKCADDLDYYW